MCKNRVTVAKIRIHAPLKGVLESGVSQHTRDLIEFLRRKQAGHAARRHDRIEALEEGVAEELVVLH